MEEPDLPLVIREMRSEDAVAAAALSAELGYPVDAPILEARLDQFHAMNDHIVLVACLEGEMAGWIDVGIVHHLQSGTYGEIGGLIVSSACRGRGIGGQLVKAAEDWLLRHSVKEILVRSQLAREAAHSFYLKQSFSRVKTTAVFSKSLG